MTGKSKKLNVLQVCLGRPQKLNELVEYSNDSIVSKTILDKAAGTITLFAFDKGQKLSEHTSPYHAVVEVIDGNGIFTIAGKDMDVSAGEIIIMPEIYLMPLQRMKSSKCCLQ